MLKFNGSCLTGGSPGWQVPLESQPREFCSLHRHEAASPLAVDTPVPSPDVGLGDAPRAGGRLPSRLAAAYSSLSRYPQS